MKSALKQFNQIKLDISPGTNRGLYSVSFIHTLRLDIKKINALMVLIKANDNNFRRRTAFKPFKKVFDLAGEIREVQREKLILNPFFKKKWLLSYQAEVLKHEVEANKNFQALNPVKLKVPLQNALQKLVPFIKAMSKSDVREILLQEEGSIFNLLRHKHIKPEAVHALRKRLKVFLYTVKGFDWKIKGKREKNITRLTDRMGRWHDLHQVINNLQKVVTSNTFPLKENRQLKTVIASLQAENEALLAKINC